MIPKIIHQIWIGPKEPPIKPMNTWKNKHLNFEYIRWNEEEFIKRDMKFECQDKIDKMTEINGKADIIRWEILYKYGGVFIDADSICIESIDDTLMNQKCFAGYEQEELRPGLIATGTMGFPPKHPLIKDAIDFVKKNHIHTNKAWITVGPGLLTRLYNSGKYKDLTIFPSYTFLPIHYTNKEYQGHGKVYAYQLWGSTNFGIFDKSGSVPKQLLVGNDFVSVLVSSYNTKAKYIKECLNSIKNQKCNTNIELVWVNDGSDELNTLLLKKLLEDFEKTTRFIKVVYSENDGNKGIGFSLNKGVELCSNEIIIKMDSDDIMVNDRIIKQLKYMKDNPNVKICGGQVRMFNSNRILSLTNHPSITWEDYKQNRPHWFINHPTVCYRKSAVLEAGNYSNDLKIMAEDFELELRMLKKYRYIHNFSEILLNYRIHEDQVTHNGGKGGSEKWNDIRNKMIDDMVNNDVKKNLVLITSVINTPNKPLSYSSIRSVFTRKERFEQTKKTIKSIKDKIPNNKIIIVECTDFTKEEKDYLEKECEYILNLWNKKELHDNIFGRSKSLGEGTMTIEALKYIEELKIEFDYLYKISGRYWLNENFKINKDDNNVFKKINNDENNIFTALYKIDKETIHKLLEFLINNIENMKKCIGYEVLVSHFVKNINKNLVDTIGLSGFVTVCGSEYNG